MDGFIKTDNTDHLSDDDYRIYRYAEIDARTRELIAQGHTYASKVFSMSDNAQRNWQALDSIRTELTYPYTISTKDSLDTYDIVDATDMHNFFMNALNTSASHQLSGQALRIQINNATTRAEMEAIIDNR